MVKYRCLTHKIEVEIEGNKRVFGGEGLSWAGTPFCVLFVLREVKEGTYGECVIKRVG